MDGIIIIYFVESRLEELHSLEYRRDADLFADQEHRHKSQMQLHRSHQDGNSKTQREKSSNVTGKKNLQNYLEINKHRLKTLIVYIIF